MVLKATDILVQPKRPKTVSKEALDPVAIMDGEVRPLIQPRSCLLIMEQMKEIG